MRVRVHLLKFLNKYVGRHHEDPKLSYGGR